METPTMMILGESTDKATDWVCHWLRHWNVPFLRLNEGNEVNPVVGMEFENSEANVHLYKSGCRYGLSNLKKTWFRRGYFLFRYIDDIPTLAQETNRSIKETSPMRARPLNASYTTIWEGQEGYVPVEECGTYSRETGFVPDKDKIAELNKRIWNEEE